MLSSWVHGERTYMKAKADVAKHADAGEPGAGGGVLWTTLATFVKACKYFKTQSFIVCFLATLAVLREPERV